jgi:predicted nucleic acid-binding protein
LDARPAPFAGETRSPAPRLSQQTDRAGDLGRQSGRGADPHAELSRATGVDAVSLLTASRVHVHHPDEAIARRVAKLRTSLADGFAAATAQEIGARLHTTDAELVRQLRGTRLLITHY